MPRETNVDAARPAVVTLRLIALPTVALFAFFRMKVALFLQHPTPDAQYNYLLPACQTVNSSASAANLSAILAIIA
jgi:hypothetical protein